MSHEKVEFRKPTGGGDGFHQNDWGPDVGQSWQGWVVRTDQSVRCTQGGPCGGNNGALWSRRVPMPRPSSSGHWEHACALCVPRRAMQQTVGRFRASLVEAVEWMGQVKAAGEAVVVESKKDEELFRSIRAERDEARASVEQLTEGLIATEIVADRREGNAYQRGLDEGRDEGGSSDE